MIIQKAKEGDKEAMSQLYDLFSKEMHGICMRMTGDSNDAKDALQNAFIKAFCKIDTLKDDSSFAGWLRKIVINECLHQKRIQIRNDEITDHQEYIQETDTDEWYAEIETRQINEAIEDLPEGYRHVFTLFAIETFSHMEIVQVLQISEATSRSQYHRAKELLKKKLLKYKSTHG